MIGCFKRIEKIIREKRSYSLRQNSWDTFVSSRPQCWCTRSGDRIAINNIGREKGSTRGKFLKFFFLLPYFYKSLKQGLLQNPFVTFEYNIICLPQSVCHMCTWTRWAHLLSSYELLASHLSFKYNVSELGTYFECEGVKWTYFNFTWWPWKRSRRGSKKPKFGLKYGLHHTWEHTWPIRNGSHVHVVHVQRFQDSNQRRDW